MAKVLIPTPLRQFTGKQDAVSVSGATVGEVLDALTAQIPRSAQADLHRRRQGAQLRQRVSERRRHPLPGQGRPPPVEEGDTISLVPSIAGGATIAAPPEAAAALSNDEILRYSRHLIMPEVGMEGQRKLKAAKVLLVGAGGLGAPLGLYLAAAGVGRIGLVDFDVVDFTNLQRQVIHSTKDVGRKKLDSAAEKMRGHQSATSRSSSTSRAHQRERARDLKDYDIVVDGTDNFPTRYLVNDACVLLGKPNVYGSIFRFEGQATVFAYRAARAIAASIPSRRLPAWCRAAPKAACWAFCPAPSA